MQGIEHIVLALPVFVKRDYLKLQFVKINNELQNRLIIPLLKTSDLDDEICSPDVSWKFMLL